MTTIGKIILIGAGAGPADLISRSGLARLNSADAVVTDRLLDPGLLAGIAPEKITYVGKGPGRHSVPQDQINHILVDLARAGKTVVRLKGGDPFIFGRGGEELDALAAAGIPFEIVPGITAASVAAAFAGIPLTHRDLTGTLCFVTGHEDPAKDSSALDYHALAKMGTIVLYMGITRLRQTLLSLISAGLDPATPAAIIENAGSGQQRTFTAHAGCLADLAEQESVKPPALVILGHVVQLREKFAWFEQKPLFGKTVVLTRPADRVDTLYRQLTDLGARVLCVPTIELTDMPDYTQLDAILGGMASSSRPCLPAPRSTLNAPQSYDWLVLTSPKTIEVVLNRLKHLNLDIRALGHFKIAVIGRATGDTIRSYFLEPDLTPAEFTSKALTEALIAEDIQGKRILLLRAELADNDMTRDLTAAGAEVTCLPAYRTKFIDTIEPITLELLQKSRSIDFLVFTSSSTARSFFDLVKKYNLEPNIQTAKLISIGPVTTDQLTQLGHSASFQAREQSAPGLLDAILAHAQESG
jgi:uroporphyrinogen III methyltransferase/synthase